MAVAGAGGVNVSVTGSVVEMGLRGVGVTNVHAEGSMLHMIINRKMPVFPRVEFIWEVSYPLISNQTG